MTPLPAAYAWLSQEPGPKMLKAALSLYGTHEAPGGTADNPVILNWAKSLGVTGYNHDTIPWCGLAMAEFAMLAGKDLRSTFAHPNDVLWALNWLRFGTSAPQPMLGDVLCFVRPGGGHVGLYVGEDADAFHVLGGNEGDAVAIIRMARIRLKGARRPHYLTELPQNVRVVRLAANGSLSANEA